MAPAAAAAIAGFKTPTPVKTTFNLFRDIGKRGGQSLGVHA